ncbi:MAG: hypothetical protein MUF75_06230 [Bacteroidia bacterium]|jgi:hypothetical protein|nr:hypothetical protein [Bacteroidia bacterium]
MQNTTAKAFSWLLFLFGFYYYCIRLIGLHFEYTPGDYGDSRFINYVLEHGYKWLLGIEPDFWRANFMYPLENNIAISDAMGGVLPIYAFFRFLGCDTEHAYQLWWMTCSALNYLCSYWAFRKFGFSIVIAALGAYLFAFGINNLNQFMHLQINCKFFIPLVIAQLYLFLTTGKLKHQVFALLAFVFQFYSNAYLAIYLALFCLLFLVFFLISEKRYTTFSKLITRKTLLFASLAFGVSLLLISLVALPYYQMGKTLGGALPYTAISHGLPHFLSYFLPHQMVVVWDFLKSSPIKQDDYWYLHDYFPGLFVYLGAGLAFVYFMYWLITSRKGFPLPLIIFFICVIFILLFSRTRDHHSLFIYFQSWPGFSNMRLPGRFMAVVVFCFIWLGLWFLNTLTLKKFRYLPFILAPLIIADNLFDIQEGYLRTPSSERRYRTAVFEELIRQSNTSNAKIIAVVNTKNDDELFQIDVMLATQKMNLYTFNGYSSNCFGELCFAFHDPLHKQLKAWMKRHYIDDKQVTFINF